MVNKIYVWKCLKENQEKREQETDNENSVSVRAHINQISLTHSDTQCSADTITEHCFAMVLDIYSLPEPRLQAFLNLVRNRRLREQPWVIVGGKIFCIGNEADVTLTLVWEPQSKK